MEISAQLCPDPPPSNWEFQNCKFYTRENKQTWANINCPSDTRLAEWKTQHEFDAIIAILSNWGKDGYTGLYNPYLVNCDGDCQGKFTWISDNSKQSSTSAGFVSEMKGKDGNGEQCLMLKKDSKVIIINIYSNDIYSHNPAILFY